MRIVLKHDEIANSHALSPEALAKRWGIKTATLTRWRNERRGPTYMAVFGAHIMYKIHDVVLYELQHQIRGKNGNRNCHRKRVKRAVL